MLNSSSKWLSFYIYLPLMDNIFLTEYLPDLINELKSEKLIQRFFFIRYGEGGYHIRLRVIPTRFIDRKVIEKKLQDKLHIIKKESLIKKKKEIRLEVSEYNRTEHYFGESLETVYSELINEQTSLLSLKLLPLFEQSKKAHAILLLPSLYLMFSESSDDRKAFLTGITDSIEFILNSEYYDSSMNESFTQPTNEQSEITTELITRTVKNFTYLPEIQKTVKLLKRCRKQKKLRFVATHSIHLYLNKMNFSMSQELKLYRLLQHIPFNL
jgi:thiopeptide-type bacteriocin biosynthesis protein